MTQVSEDDMTMILVGSLYLDFTKGLFFNSSVPKLLFIKKEQGSIMMHVPGTVAHGGKQSLFDLITFDHPVCKIDPHEIIVYDHTPEPVAPKFFSGSR